MATKLIGGEPQPLRDLYHALLRAPWRWTFAVIAGGFLAINALFALVYWQIGGITGPGDYLHAFFFSVQTMGTIGYGVLEPEATRANLVVVGEAIVSLILTALATGLVFAKFSRPTARMLFSKHVVISPMDGVPTLALRIGNLRGNSIIDTQIRLVLVRKETTREGKIFYRMLDLPPTRERAPSLSRAWVVLHTIDERSPLHGATPEMLEAWDAEIDVLVVGLDDTQMASVHAIHRYDFPDVKFGMRLADILTEEGGDFIIDLTKFHDIEAV